MTKFLIIMQRWDDELRRTRHAVCWMQSKAPGSNRHTGSGQPGGIAIEYYYYTCSRVLEENGAQENRGRRRLARPEHEESTRADDSPA